MRDDDTILIVGTTADYIEWIECRSRTNALFLTAQRERERAVGKFHTPEHEILVDLNRPDLCLQLLQDYLRSAQTDLAGIACFDDESLPLAALLANELALEFPSEDAIRQCLDKHVSKQVWHAHGVPCPNAQSISCHSTERDLETLSFPCVLKPHSGSGSERVFLCHTPEQVHEAMLKITATTKGIGDRVTAVAETFIAGTEFSCDFSITDGNVQILRTARKYLASGAPLGTALAYILPAQLSPRMVDTVLPDILARAADAMGISRAICMVDFIITDDNDVVLLELSPRMGGDCLPHILLEGWGIDTISATVEFARGTPITPWLKESAPTVVGLRVFAPAPGMVAGIDTHTIDSDPRLLSHNLHACLGRTVVLPPEDYSSWLLGHVIFQPYLAEDLEDQILELRESLCLHLEEVTV